jgi:hypothetical protein
MDIIYYKRLNSINGFNALDYPEVIYDPEYTNEVLECAIRNCRPDIINKLVFNHLIIKVDWYLYCTDIPTLNIIKSLLTMNENDIKELIIADNLTAIDVFEICLDFYAEYIEQYIPVNIIRRILPNPFLTSFDVIFHQALLMNNYEVCEIVIGQIKKDKSDIWEAILNCTGETGAKIVDLCMKYFTIPKESNTLLMSIAIENGHYEFVKLNYDGKTIYSIELLSKLISQNMAEKVIKLQSLNLFDNIVGPYLYVNNLFGYTFYRDRTGFKYQTIMHDIIAERQIELIKLISNEYEVEPSIDYLVLALGGDCPETLLTVLNHLVTKDQIIASISINEITVINRMCYIVYLRVLKSLGLLPNQYIVHQMAIKFDSPTILKFIPYDRAFTIYDSIINGCNKIYKLCYCPDIIIPDNILLYGYNYLASCNNIDLMYLLATRYGVPDSYKNKYGGRGTIQLTKDFSFKNK